MRPWLGGLLLCLCAWPLMAVAQLPSRTVESIDYLDQDGAVAVEISFSGPVQYLSHFPLERGASVEIFLGPRSLVDPEVDTLPFTQALRAPKSKQIPLSQVTFQINERGDISLSLNFTQVLRFKVMGGSDPATIRVVLPDLAAKALPAKAVAAAPPVAAPKDSLENMLREGREALKDGHNARAIQVFTKLLSLPAHKYSPLAMELLGVARERNGQAAHAKVLYEEYLKQYPQDEGVTRVKQRLADLLSGQIKPKLRLKAAKKPRAKAMESQFYGSFAQYYYRGQNDVENVGSSIDQSLLLNQLSLNWRLRNEDYDIRNILYASQSQDFISDTGKAPTVETAYSQIKNNRLGFTGKLGRQYGSGGGVLGKFDGLRASYDMRRTLSVNTVLGYPVDISDKRHLQSDKPFWGVGFAWDGEGKAVDILPYYIHQQVDGIVDREAVGSEFRYFNPLGNFYALIDYDIAYSDLNIYLFRGQYNWRQDTVLNFSMDYRNNPLLFTSNALLGRTDVTTIDELLATHSEQQVYDLAESQVGNAATVSLGMSHTFNDRYQLSADLTHAVQVYVLEDVTTGVLSSERELQTYLYVQLIANRWLNERDTSVFGLRLSQTSSYDEVSLSASNRLPLGRHWRIDSRLRLDLRHNDSGEESTKLRPSVKLDHNPSQRWHFEAELGMELWRYSGTTNNPDFSRLFATVGYRWDF
jgi:hypothetical protein